MWIKKWEKLPPFMQTDEVRPYWERLRKKNFVLLWKRLFDIFTSSILIVLLSPIFAIISMAIVIDSKGPIFFRQERVTQYGKIFRIFKFRSMVNDSNKKGSLITVNNDERITKVGKFIRKYRLDEISQLIDVFRGTMTFVGTRPEVPRYVDKYSNEMLATLLLPAGITSMTSITFKNENSIIDKNNEAITDDIYVKDILPGKMKHNLEELMCFGFWRDIGIMFKTIVAILKK